MSISLVPALSRDLNSSLRPLETGLSTGFADPAEGRATLAEILSTLGKGRADLPHGSQWGSYWGCSEQRRAFVGLCGFKAGPDPSGSVEIAYFTFPSCEGHGVASGMAGALVGIARSAGLTQVLAHTLPVKNASAAVLTRIGFSCEGAVHDPEDGEVWRWRLRFPGAG